MKRDTLRLLFLEPNSVVAEYLTPRLAERSFQVHRAKDVPCALAKLHTSVFNLIIIDQDELGDSLESTLTRVMRVSARTPVFVVSMNELGDAAIAAAALGAQGSLQIYPGCEDELAIRLRCAVHRHQLRRERKLVDVQFSPESTGEFRISTLQAVTAEIKSVSMEYARRTADVDHRA